MCFAIVVGSGRPWLQWPVAVISLLGGLGPLLVALWLIGRSYWRRDRNPWAFLMRVMDPTTLSWRSYAVTLGATAVLVFLPLFVEMLRVDDAGIWHTGPFVFMIVGLVFGALEEVGWRGYAQEALQQTLPIWISGLVIGVFWSLWHLPLFFVEGTYQAQLGFGTLSFWTFMLNPIVASPFYAWLYNVTGRTAFAAVLYHGLGNLGRELVADPHPMVALSVELTMTVVVLILSWGWMRRRAQ